MAFPTEPPYGACMTTYRFQHSIQDIDQLSKDRYVTTFYSAFIGDATDTQLAGTAAVIKSFYQVAGDPNTIVTMLAKHCDGEGTTIKAYVVDTAPHHEPVYTETYDLGISADNEDNLPGEVAVVLSYKSNVAPTVALGRTRGRIYIGPLNHFASTNDGVRGPARPSVTMMNALLAGAATLKSGFSAAGGSWVVESPTLMKALAPVHSFAVTSASVDNAFDTQRRRGVGASLRTPAVLV